jgi:hypothetical protein
MSFDFVGRYLARHHAKVVERVCCAEVGSVVTERVEVPLGTYSSEGNLS